MLSQFQSYAKTAPQQFNGIAPQPFNGIVAMQEHLDQCKQVEDFVNGTAVNLPNVPTACDGDCTLAKWLHSESGKDCKDFKLVNSLCKSCTEFREAASYVVFLAHAVDMKLAKEAVQPGGSYSTASEEFQQNLVEFNLRYSAWATGLV